MKYNNWIRNNATVYKTVLNQNNIFSESWSVVKTKVLWAQENLFWWRAFDPNCPIDDIHIWDQVWAGCNSTLWDWFEWGQLDSDIGSGTYSSTSIACHDYDGNSPAAIYGYCEAGSEDMMSYSNAQKYFSHVQSDNINDAWDRELDAIWWKFYMWEDSMSACPVWRKLPNLQDWESSLQVLNDGVACGVWWAWSICDGLWWAWHTTKNDTNNIVNKLRIPLSWYRHDNRVRFDQRWILTYLWFAFGENPDPYRIRFSAGGTSMNIIMNNQDYAFSVRCIKD